MMKGIAGLLLLLGVLAGVCILLLFVFQRRLLYPAPRHAIPKAMLDQVERVEFNQGYFLFLPPLEPSSAPSLQANELRPDLQQGPAETGSNKQRMPVIIHSHGNAELAYDWVEQFDEFRKLGFGIALVEYPSYGGAAGKPSLQSIQQLMQQTYDTVTSRDDVDPDRIVGHGRSIGGGAACLLAKHRKLAALVLESTFSELSTLVSQLRYPSVFLLDRYDNAAIVASFEKPLFIYHGSDDALISISHAEKLHALAPSSEFHIARCGHSDCPRPDALLIDFFRQQKLL